MKFLTLITAFLAMLLITSLHQSIVMAQQNVNGTQDDTWGVWLFNAGTTVPAGAPTSDIIERAVFYDILDYIGDITEEVYDFGYGPSEPTTGQQDTTEPEVINGLSSINDFGYLANSGDDAANFDTGSNGYFLGGFDPDEPYVIVSDGITATGVLGPSGAASATAAEEAIDGYEIFIFEDAELSGVTVTLSNNRGLNIAFTIADLQVDPPTRDAADDTLIAIDLDNMTEFDGTYIDTLRIQDDNIPQSRTNTGDTTLEIDAIAVRKSVKRRLTGSIGDTVFLDENENGVQDLGEEGFASATVTLASQEETTNEDGLYLFDDLPAGTYAVEVQVPPGYYATTTTICIVDLGLGEDLLDADFGFAPEPVELGSISGTVWDDSDMDGTQDPSELGISGVTVFFDLNGDGDLDIGEPERTTDGNGAYLFEDLLPGTYDVTIIVPADYYPTTPTMLSIELIDAEDITDVDFGLVRLGSIGDRVWNDLNIDGVQDVGETGFAGGATIHLGGSDASEAEWHLNAVSDGSGMYLFEGLPPGTYTATLTVPVGYLPTTTISHIVELDENEDYLDADFGIVQPSRIYGTKFEDMDEDGDFDEGEPGIPVATIKLLGSVGEIFRVVTDTNGNYEFTYLMPGSYTVVHEDLEGYYNTTANEVQVNLEPGQEVVVNFGDIRILVPPCVGGYMVLIEKTEVTPFFGSSPLIVFVFVIILVTMLIVYVKRGKKQQT
jgi:hypothetical protein